MDHEENNYLDEVTQLWTDPYLNGSKSTTDYSAKELIHALYWTNKKDLIAALKPDLTECHDQEQIEKLWKAVVKADEELRTIGTVHLIKIIDYYNKINRGK